MTSGVFSLGQPSKSQKAVEGRRAVFALGLLLASGLCAVISIPAVLLLGPALFLFFVLSLGYFPGERVIEKVVRWRNQSRVAAVPSIEPAQEPLDLVAKVGRQIAYALAVRPPPYSLGCRI